MDRTTTQSAEAPPSEGSDPRPWLRQVFAGPMGNCLYIVGDPSSRECVIFDPAFDPLGLMKQARADGYEVKAVVATHFHQDHVGGEIFGHQIPGLRELLAKETLPIYIHEVEAERMVEQTGIQGAEIRTLQDGSRIPVGELELQVLHTPGHSPGSCCFLSGGIMVAGDTLFVQGVGRVDLPGSDVDQMFHSLRRLAALPPETEIYPGHNYGPAPSSTIGRELQLNPYLRPTELAQWRIMMGVL